MTPPEHHWAAVDTWSVWRLIRALTLVERLTGTHYPPLRRLQIALDRARWTRPLVTLCERRAVHQRDAATIQGLARELANARYDGYLTKVHRLPVGTMVNALEAIDRAANAQAEADRRPTEDAPGKLPPLPPPVAWVAETHQADIHAARNETPPPAGTTAVDTERADAPITPVWDPRSRTLTYGTLVCRTIRRAGTNVERLLTAFENAQWPTSIKNPFDCETQLDETLKSLKGNGWDPDSPIDIYRDNLRAAWKPVAK